MSDELKVWRVSVRKNNSSRYNDYYNIKAVTREEAEKIALAKPGVTCVNWVAEPDSDRTR